MKFSKSRNRANYGYARILETLVAATIIFIVFAASSFFVNNSQIKVVQERTDLDRLGYNALSRLTESGTIEATIEKTENPVYNLKAFLQHSLPSSIFFSLTVMKWSQSEGKLVDLQLPITNADSSSFSNSIALSSTPITYTSKNSNNYYLILVLANAGEGT